MHVYTYIHADTRKHTDIGTGTGTVCIMSMCVFVSSCVVVCLCACMCVCLYVCLCGVWVCLCVHACMHACVCVCMYMCACVRVSKCSHTSILCHRQRMAGYSNLCAHVCVCVCVCVCVKALPYISFVPSATIGWLLQSSAARAASTFSSPSRKEKGQDGKQNTDNSNKS